MLFSSKKALALTVSVFLLTSFVVLFALISYLHWSYKAQEIKIYAQNEQVLQTASETIYSGLEGIIASTQFLAESLKVAFMAEKHVRNTQSHALLKEFMASDEYIDQARVLDMEGQEQIRFNRKSQQIQQVTYNKLQNKAGRYYFKDGLSLLTGQVALSRIDLNVENGRVELPIKPTLRVTAPIFDAENQQVGVLVVNYLVNKFTQKIQRLNKSDLQQVWLVDDRLDWMIAPNGQRPWATDLQLENHNLSTYLPMLAEQVKTIPKPGLVWRNEGLMYHVKRINPASEFDSFNFKRVFNRAGDSFLVVVHKSPLTWQQQLFYGGEIIRLSAVIFVVIGLISILVGVISFRRYQLQEYVSLQKQMITEFFNHAPNIMLICDEKGRLVFSNNLFKSLMAELENDQQELKRERNYFESEEGRMFILNHLRHQEEWTENKVFIAYDDQTRYFTQ